MPGTGPSAPFAPTSFSYDAASDTYTVEGISSQSTSSNSVSFTQGDKVTGTGYGVSYLKTNAGITDTLTLYGNGRAGTSGTPPIQLSYTSFGIWTTSDSNRFAANYFIFGQQTAAADVPKSGTASYDTFVAARKTEMRYAPFDDRAIPGTATFSADFAAGQVSTTLSLVGKTFDGTAPIDGNGFWGHLNLAGTSTGDFGGGFFGPGAKEVGYGFYITLYNPDPYAGATVAPMYTYLTGVVVGRKQ